MAFGVEEVIRRGVFRRDSLGNAEFNAHRLGLRQFTRRVLDIKQQRRKIKKQLQKGITPTEDYTDLADLIVYRYGSDRRYFSEHVLYDIEDYLNKDIDLCDDFAEIHVCLSKRVLRSLFGMSKYHLSNAQVLLEKAVHDVYHMRSFGFINEEITTGRLSYFSKKQRQVRMMIECPMHYGDLERLEKNRREAEECGDHRAVSAIDLVIDARLETKDFSDYLDEKLL